MEVGAKIGEDTPSGQGPERASYSALTADQLLLTIPNLEALRFKAEMFALDLEQIAAAATVAAVDEAVLARSSGRPVSQPTKVRPIGIPPAPHWEPDKRGRTIRRIAWPCMYVFRAEVRGHEWTKVGITHDIYRRSYDIARALNSRTISLVAWWTFASREHARRLEVIAINHLRGSYAARMDRDWFGADALGVAAKISGFLRLLRDEGVQARWHARARTLDEARTFVVERGFLPLVGRQHGRRSGDRKGGAVGS
jgi:hypothetical protein